MQRSASVVKLQEEFIVVNPTDGVTHIDKANQFREA